MVMVCSQSRGVKETRRVAALPQQPGLQVASAVGLSKHANQSFHMQQNLRSQSRGEANQKIDKIIRKNLKKQKEKDEQKKKEQDAKTLRDLERKQQIQLNNKQ